MFHQKPAGSEEDPREENPREENPAEENDLLNSLKKTQPKKTPIVKPADLPRFQNANERVQWDLRRARGRRL
jgi:hypothetical protein